jgi:hypothetical protein
MNIYVEFGAVTDIITKRSVFWDITLCSTPKIAGVSEEHVASIFSVEDPEKKKKSAWSR